MPRVKKVESKLAFTLRMVQESASRLLLLEQADPEYAEMLSLVRHWVKQLDVLVDPPLKDAKK